MIVKYIIPESIVKKLRQLEFNITSSDDTPTYKNIPTPDLVSDDEKIDTTNLKVGDKVWIEAEVESVSNYGFKHDNITIKFDGYKFTDHNDDGVEIPLSAIKKIIPKQE